MKADIVAALTPYELNDIIDHAAKLLLKLKRLEGTNAMVKSLQKLIMQGFENVQEHYCERTIPSPFHAYRDDIIECLAYKQIGDCKYYSDGSVQIFYYNDLTLEPWQPKNPKILQLISKNTKKFRGQFEQRISGLTKELSQDDIKREDKAFWNALGSEKYSFLKYQVHKFLNKDVKISKRFLINGKQIWQFVNILKKVIIVDKDTDVLSASVNKAYSSLSKLLKSYLSYRSNHRIDQIGIYSFTSVEDLKEAYNKRSLQYSEPDQCGFQTVQHYYSTDFIPVQNDPDISNYRNYYSMALINWIYSLQKQADDNLLNPELKDFLEIQGIIKKGGSNNV